MRVWLVNKTVVGLSFPQKKRSDVIINIKELDDVLLKDIGGKIIASGK